MMMEGWRWSGKYLPDFLTMTDIYGVVWKNIETEQMFEKDCG